MHRAEEAHDAHVTSEQDGIVQPSEVLRALALDRAVNPASGAVDDAAFEVRRLRLSRRCSCMLQSACVAVMVATSNPAFTQLVAGCGMLVCGN